MHCQNADWATPFLLHKFNISAQDSLVGTDFGKYVKYKRPEKRGGKTFLSGKSWTTTVRILPCCLFGNGMSSQTFFGTRRTFVLLRPVIQPLVLFP